MDHHHLPFNPKGSGVSGKSSTGNATVVMASLSTSAKDLLPGGVGGKSSSDSTSSSSSDVSNNSTNSVIYSRFLPGLRSASSNVRIRTARALRIFLESESRDLTPLAYSKCIDTLSIKILEMLRGSDNMNKIGGILAMDELVDLFISESNDSKIMEFAHGLARVLEKASNSDTVMLRAAAKALGHLVSTGGTTLIEFVEEYHMKPALTWLEKDSFHVRRHAAVMILKELAMNAPSIFYRHVDSFFEVIWNAFGDSKMQLRESAAEALQACYILIQQRETNKKNIWYNRSLTEVGNGLVKNTADSMHGSLLIMNELLRNSGDFMYPHFDKVCKQVLEYRDHKNSVVRRAVINLFPRLAKFNSSVYIDNYLVPCLNHILEILNTPSSNTKGEALLSAGKLALAIGPSISRSSAVFGEILRFAIVGLKETNKKREFDTQREALACIRMLAESVGHTLPRKEVDRMITALFQGELNRTFIDTLTTIAKRIPNQRAVVQVNLFKRLVYQLHAEVKSSSSGGSSSSASPGKPPSSSSSSQSSNIFSFISEKVNAHVNLSSADATNDASVVSTGMKILALETLGSFDFQGNREIPLVQFVHNVVVKFLDHEVAGIRKAAAITCCKLVLPPGEEAPTKGENAMSVSGVLERLLTVGIADSEADIRSKVLFSLDKRFDPLLGQPDHLNCLYIALNDEIFEIRETAMNILGRLTRRNPSYVMPSLRQTLVQLLTELEFSCDSRGKEESARLLGHLIHSGSHLSRPYVLPLLKALMKNIRHPSASVGRAVLGTLGELALVGKKDLLPYLGQLLPEILEAMQEKNKNFSLLKMRMAIRTFGQLVSSTGYVIRPYFEYPNLLKTLCGALQKSGDMNDLLRLEAGKTLGILGALDPYSAKLLRTNRFLQKGSPQNLLLFEQGTSKYISLVGDSAAVTATTSNNANNTTADDTNPKNITATNGNGTAGGTNTNNTGNGKNNAAGAQLSLHSVKVVPAEDMLPSLVEDPAQYFPAVAINSLIRILIEPRNFAHYQGTYLAIMYICKSLGKKAEPHLHKIVPIFLQSCQRVDNLHLRNFLFEQLSLLVRIVGDRIQPHLDHRVVASIIYSYWGSHLSAILNLVQGIARSLEDDFRVYLPDLVPELLAVIRREREQRLVEVGGDPRPQTQLVLKTITSLGRLLDGYLHLIIPVLVKLIQSGAEFLPRRSALTTLGTLIRQVPVKEFSSKIILMLARVLNSNSHGDLEYLAMDCLCCMVYTLRGDFAVFVPVIHQVLKKNAHTEDIFDRYDLLVSKILKYQTLPITSSTPAYQQRKKSILAASSSGSSAAASNTSTSNSTSDEVKSLPINQSTLMKAWESSHRSTKDDWYEWMRAFSVELLRESPSPALRSCKELASVHQPLARELFNSAFVSVWPHLSTPTQDNLIRSIEYAFHSPNLPNEILTTLLNLAEFMEHDDQPLPIDIRLLGSLAEKCHSFAKALHYKELEFNTNPSSDGIEALISINNKLSQFEAAVGILKYAQNHLSDVKVKASWHEKLNRWDDALVAHNHVLNSNSTSFSEVLVEEDATLFSEKDKIEATFGKMRCLYALGKWRELNEHVNETWEKVYGDNNGSTFLDELQPKTSRSSSSLRRSRSSSSHIVNNSASSSGMNQQSHNANLLDVPPLSKKELCSYAARVALHLQDWSKLPTYINSDMEETEAYLYRAVLKLRHMELDEAMSSISSCRRVIDPSLCSLVSESYARAYMPNLIHLQNLTELEEIIQFTKVYNGYDNLNKEGTASSNSSANNAINNNSSENSHMEVRSYAQERQKELYRLRNVWNTRMMGVERNIQVWQQLIMIRSLVLDPKEDIDIWLKYAQLCRKNGHLNLALSALWRVGAQPFIRSVERHPLSPVPIVLHGPDALKPHPRVAFCYFKHLYADNQEEVAVRQLAYLIEALERRAENCGEDEEMTKLRVQAYIQLGEWQMALLEPNRPCGDLYDQVLTCLDTATKLDPVSYKAWHEWALMNFKATENITNTNATVLEERNHREEPKDKKLRGEKAGIEECEDEEEDDDANRLRTRTDSTSSGSLVLGDITRYVAPAVNGFFQSIVLGGQRHLDVTKDVLRLLTLWFSHGDRQDVHNAMSQGFQLVSINTWLDVIPQLIARIHSPNAPTMNTLLHELLSRIGLSHPQALIYPITVAAKSQSLNRKTAAQNILNRVTRHSPQLVQEAELVSRELIRVSILWNELWYGALEDASRYYFNMSNPSAMIAELAPLHELMDSIGINEEPTLREVAFHQAFARDLKTAKEWTNRFEQTKKAADLNQAWDIYYSIFAKVRKQLAQLTTLELANVGPRLLAVNTLTLAVPGTYEPRNHQNVIQIGCFAPKITVLSSKQRPRRLTIQGSNGHSYPFLLKGHEDLRQDERVMQLFGLINTLLANDSDTNKRNLAIERYSVLPLSHSSGLIGWVPDCDTLHQLIRDYREARKIQLNVEHRLMVQLAPDYDKLALMHKVEAFKYALSETTGQDLYKVLWLKSQNSEVWLDRRRNYTRSLAVMSMAGYILGLGDRHPSNLMLARHSGKIVHIDFGDCFEVAMERDKYPEKVPFRLTRMLTQAMEVSGIEGNFRSTCESSMRVLRENRDSLMAVLEAFVYDPLITWKLLTPNAVPSHAKTTNKEKSTQQKETSNNAKEDSDEIEVDDEADVAESKSLKDREDEDDDDDEKERGSIADDSKYRTRNSSADTMLGLIPKRSLNNQPSAKSKHMKMNEDDEVSEMENENEIEEGRNESNQRRRNNHNVNDQTSSPGGNTMKGEEFSYNDNGIIPEQLNEKAVKVIERVQNKLRGRDFEDADAQNVKHLSVEAQVDRLILQATSHENLCQLYFGWCPFW